jgi:hypothetical protein
MTNRNELVASLVSGALLIALISGLLDLRQVHADLEKAAANQKSAIDGNAKVEAQLDALAKGVNQLAQSGNTNAQHIVATLKASGVNIK